MTRHYKDSKVRSQLFCLQVIKVRSTAEAKDISIPHTNANPRRNS